MTEQKMTYKPTRRRLLRDATLTSLGLVAAACAPGTTGTTGTTGGGAAKGGEFHGGWPFVLQPQGHWNYYATNAILGGSIYMDTFLPTLGVYRWAENKWDYWLPASGKQTGDHFQGNPRSRANGGDGTGL